MVNNVFISYSRKDQEYVRKLAEDLDQRLDGGVWFDQSDIQAGDKWRERLVNGIREAQLIVCLPTSICISASFFLSRQYRTKIC